MIDTSPPRGTRDFPPPDDDVEEEGEEAYDSDDSDYGPALPGAKLHQD